MPTLALYTICEKVIQDKEGDGVVSLISLFTSLTVNVPPGTPAPPKDAVAPKEWAVYTSWKPEENDHGKSFVSCIQVLYPDGTQFGETAKYTLVMEANRRAQTIVRIPGFPLGQKGFYKIHTWLELDGKRVTAISDLEVELKIVEIVAAKPA